MEGIAENLYSIKNTARELTPQKLRQGLQTAAAETENIFSRCRLVPMLCVPAFMYPLNDTFVDDECFPEAVDAKSPPKEVLGNGAAPFYAAPCIAELHYNTRYP